MSLPPWSRPLPAYDVEAVIGCLARHRVAYVLVGGTAAVVHGSPVLTQDVDVLPEQSMVNLDRLAQALAELKAVPYDDPERVDPRTGRVPEAPDFAYTGAALARHDTWHLVTEAGLLDVLASLSGVEGGYLYVRQSSGVQSIFGHSVVVAGLDVLIASKQAANRPKDRATLPLLEALRERRQRDLT